MLLHQQSNINIFAWSVIQKLVKIKTRNVAATLAGRQIGVPTRTYSVV